MDLTSFSDGQQALEHTLGLGKTALASVQSGEAIERHGDTGDRLAPYGSGQYRDWRKVKTMTWREASRERCRLFEQSK